MLVSKGKNTPFAGMELRGRVVLTVCEGRATFTRLGAEVGYP
jgi:dihydroorotase-like cyclic amidohydrolase